MFTCSSTGHTIPVYAVCNGIRDCEDAEDEMDCIGGYFSNIIIMSMKIIMIVTIIIIICNNNNNNYNYITIESRSNFLSSSQ